MKRLVTNVSNDELKEVQDYIEQHKTTIYALLKIAVLEKVRKETKENPGTLDKFTEEDPT
ncbi:MAG: hypothetical protein LN416_01805 [Candidatus Thermoplasmatota archaeon]|nr:hypothetical protein [Candidatus Thermoplasmatota archaeon]